VMVDSAWGQGSVNGEPRIGCSTEFGHFVHRPSVVRCCWSGLPLPLCAARKLTGPFTLRPAALYPKIPTPSYLEGEPTRLTCETAFLILNPAGVFFGAVFEEAL
jgi:hypothetical protein